MRIDRPQSVSVVLLPGHCASIVIANENPDLILMHKLL